MPDNPLMGRAGNLTRSLKLLEYLNKYGTESFEIEFLSIYDWGVWNENGIRNFNDCFPDFKLTIFDRKFTRMKPAVKLLYKAAVIIINIFRPKSIAITNYFFENKANQYINAGQYDLIIVSYASWGNIIKNLRYDPYLILDTHDFITAQSKKRKRNIGRIFQSELNVLRRFNEIWTLSIEEKYLYEQFTDSHIIHHPVSFRQLPLSNSSFHKYDILYVASHNPHNTASIDWFLKNVLPKINNYTVHIAGSICSEIKDEYHNVIKYGIVEDLDSFYKSTRITICPMLTGTGVKIKVLDSLSYNLPVITTTRGIDGLVNKTNNGCIVRDDPDGFAAAINQMIEDDSFYNKIREEAHAYFKQNHDIKKEEEFFKKLFLEHS